LAQFISAIAHLVFESPLNWDHHVPSRPTADIDES
jgi:hypothetical protein